MTDQPQTTDPLNTPLPCDVMVGHVIFRKGVSLGTLVAAAQRWHAIAKGRLSPSSMQNTLELRANQAVQGKSR